jgi:hypothetical protein
VETIDGSANDRPAAPLQRRHEFFSQRRLARGIRPIESDANRMRPLYLGDSTCEVF